MLFDGLASPAVRTQWKNEEYHKMMLDGRETVDQSKRTEIYKKAQQLLHDEVPVICVAHSTVIAPVQKKVMNFMLHPTSAMRLQNVWLE